MKAILDKVREGWVLAAVSPDDKIFIFFSETNFEVCDQSGNRLAQGMVRPSEVDDENLLQTAQDLLEEAIEQKLGEQE